MKGCIRKWTLSDLFFFWRGASNKFKYHMMGWEAVCRTKDFRGLGIINTRVMNDCLISKWVWKIHNADNELWYRIIKAKYFPDGAFRDAHMLNSS